jgi:hypothetical protein
VALGFEPRRVAVVRLVVARSGNEKQSDLGPML